MTMFDHVSIGVCDIARSKKFYDAALQPLGYRCLSDGETSLGYGKDAVALWILHVAKPVPADRESGLHFCVAAPSRDAVGKFHAAALAAGGTDNGPAGLRADYDPTYYAAYVVDPDGYRIEAYCNAADTSDSATLAELRRLNAQFIANFIANDVASHDAILHKRFLYIRANGARIDRATYLANWATGFDPAVIVYWDTRDEWITVVGDVALVRATNKYVLRKGASEETGMAAYTDIYLREGGKWLCIQAQITDVEPAHWPSEDSIVSVYLAGVLQKPPG